MKFAKDITPINSIAPQMFSIINEEFVLFEKINTEEGRFFSIRENKVNTLYNVYESQGVIEEGEFYTVKIGEKTTIERISFDPVTINLDGVFFDFKVDNDKNIICLGHNSKDSIIKIFSKDGIEIKSIVINHLFFSSCIKVIDEDIWIAGFDKENKLKIIKVNYIGALLKEIVLDTAYNDRLISKIQFDKERIYLNISGKNDSIYIMNLLGEKITEVFSKDINLDNFTDIIVLSNNIYILNSKKIYTYDVESFINYKFKSKTKVNLDNTKASYIYFTFLNVILDKFHIGIILAFLLYTFIYSLDYVYLNSIKGISLIWTLATVISLVLGFISFKKKSTRVMYLLNIQKDCIKESFQRFLFISTIVVSIISLLFIDNLRIISFIILGIILSLMYVLDSYFKKTFNYKKEDIVVGLLKGDKSLHKNIKQLMNYSKGKNKVLVNIKVKNNFNKKYLCKWNKSRLFILGKCLNYIFLDKTFISIVDFSNRDIRYSKTSIIEDLICYIEEEGKIEEINVMWVD